MCNIFLTFAAFLKQHIMEHIPSFNELIEKSIIEHWDLDALTDYKGKTLQYHDVARKIEKIHIMYEASGIKKGDKIAICGRNSSMWASYSLRYGLSTCFSLVALSVWSNSSWVSGFVSEGTVPLEDNSLQPKER